MEKIFDINGIELTEITINNAYAVPGEQDSNENSIDHYTPSVAWTIPGSSGISDSALTDYLKDNVMPTKEIEIQKDVANMAKRSSQLNNLQDRFEVVNTNNALKLWNRVLVWFSEFPLLRFLYPKLDLLLRQAVDVSSLLNVPRQNVSSLLRHIAKLSP